MGQKRQRIKRPCRICGKWFVPNPRLGERQMTCGATVCQKQWHRRKCAEWNRKNRAYSQEIYLRKRLQLADSAQPCRSSPQPVPQPTPASSPASAPPAVPLKPVAPLDYPRAVVQEVMGVQLLIIIEYIVRLLTRDVQEVIRSQLAETQKEFRPQPRLGSSRDDGQRAPAQGTLCHQT